MAEETRHGDRILKLELQYQQHNEIIAEIRETNRSIDESLRELLKVRHVLERHSGEIQGLDKDIDLYRDESTRARNDLWKKVHNMAGEKEREHRQIDVRLTSLENAHANIKWTIATLALAASLIGSAVGTIFF